LENEPVVTQDISVHGGHTSGPSAVEQRFNQLGSDASALPCVLYEDSQIHVARGTDTKTGHSHAGCAMPSEKRWVDWSMPKQGAVVGHAVGRAVKPVEQGATRAAGQHGQDSLGA
jgi:hypothetical protein